jgi:hypothetical protein
MIILSRKPNMHSVRLLVLATLLSASSLVSALPVSYQFTTIWGGELAGTITTGRFTYDLSQLDEFGRAAPLSYFTDLEFELRDLKFTEATVKVLEAASDKNGSLLRMGFGSNCSWTEVPSGETQASCGVSGDRPDQFYIAYFPTRLRSVSGAGGTHFVSTGSTSMQRIDAYDIPKDIPEPAAPLLLFSGLGVMGFIRSRLLKKTPLR